MTQLDTSITKSYMKMRFKNYDISLSLPMVRIIEREKFVPQMKVAEELNVNISTVNVHFHKLKDEGLIRPIEKKLLSGRGRPTELWTIERKRNFTVSVVFATPMLHMGLADFTGNIKLHKTVDCSKFNKLDEVYSTIDRFIKKAIAKVRKISGTIRYAYAGVPGILEPDSGKILAAVNMPLLTGLDMEHFFQSRYKIPCFADSFAYALYFGETKTLPENTTSAVVEWDLGIGILFGCGKRVFNFENFPSKFFRYLWDIGHTLIKRNGKKCRCGKRGCLEAYIGGLSIIEAINDENIKTLSDLILSIRSGHKKSIAELNKSARLLGKFMTYPVQFLGVEKIIFTGLLSEVFDVYENSFKRGLKTILSDEYVEMLSPQASVDRTRNLITGACEFARYVFLYPKECRERRRIPSVLSVDRVEKAIGSPV